MMRGACKVLIVLTSIVLLPSAAWAQASLTGTVKDTSGAVLPGVTVEAASLALIEKTRTVVTDGTGQYRIVDLRPGTYTVTFTLPGFNTVKREGIDLTGTATASVSVEMKVGAVEETITVSGEAPVVDVQNTTKQQVMSHEIIDAVPSGRLYQNLGALVPGVVSNQVDVGGATGDNMASLSVHGSKNVDMRIMNNGVVTATLQAGGGIGMATPNVNAAQEVVIDTASVSAELATGGPRINYIPRDGGNTFKGTVFVSGAGNSLQGNDLTQDLIDRGLKVADGIKQVWDINPGFGGPIKKDAVWFWYTGRWSHADNYVGGMFFNKNANDPNAWTYEPDTSKQAFNNIYTTDNQIRITWQASPRNKIAGTWDQQTRCNCPFYVGALSGGAGGNQGQIRSPEAANDRRSPTQRLLHAEWSSPITSRLLVEAVALHRTERWGNMPPALEGFLSGTAPGLIGVVEQGGAIPNLQYRSGGTTSGTFNNTWVPNYFWRAAMAYVTGAHALKVGINDAFGNLNQTTYNYQPLMYRFLNGVPNQLTQFATPFTALNNENHDLGLYAQDKWTLKRVTLTGGIRYDWFKSEFPEETFGPAQLAPTRNITFPRQDNLNWKDITPRMGAVYDVRGDGKTAVRVSLNKFLQGQGLNALGSDPNPVNTAVTNTNRSWADANRNFVPDCDLTNPLVNGECGPMANPNFGKTQPGATFDPDVLTGWGHRTSNWEFSTSMQHEILPRVSVDVGYFRRWYGNFRVTDNLAVSASDYQQFSLTVPSDPRLPGGGSYTLPGLFDLVPTAFGRPANNFNTLSDKYGKQIDHWNGVDITVNARLASGVFLQGGISTGKEITDDCEVVAKIPELLFGLPTASTLLSTGVVTTNVWQPQGYCHMEEPMLTQAKLVGSYRIPRIEVQISGTLQSVPGPVVLGNYVATNAILTQSSTLGRPLAGNAANTTVNLVKPGTTYGERLNQLDLRFGKILRAHGMRASINLDLYNALNVNPVLSLIQTYGPAWQQPLTILTARFVKFGLQFDF